MQLIHKIKYIGVMKVIFIMIFLLMILFIENDHSTGLNNDNQRSEMVNKRIQEITIDSDYSLEEALNGIKIPDDIKKNLRIVNVYYYSFDNKLHQGQVVIHEDLVQDITSIFNIIKKMRFHIAKVIPIVKYDWNDEKSMEDNNTSAFNYRFIAGTNKLSNHSTGTAIDINPLLNPYIRKDLILPEGAVYDVNKNGTITENSFLVKEFKKLGWTWGGDWKDRKDYQHFEKKPE